MTSTDERLMKQLKHEIDAMRSRVAHLESIAPHSENIGLITEAELRFGTGIPGACFSGIRIGFPPFSYNGQDWNIVGVNCDVLQIGISAVDGKFYSGTGAVLIDSDGIKIVAGTTEANFVSWWRAFSDASSILRLSCEIFNPGINQSADAAIVARGTATRLAAARLNLNSDMVVINQTANATGNFTGKITYLVGGAHTNLPASVEYNDVSLDLNRTVEFATGALVNQRAYHIKAPTYAFVGPSVITDAATFYIDRAPQAGANATITNAYTFWIGAGAVRFDGITVLNLIPYTWPAADAAVSGYVLSSNAAGALSWVAQSGGAAMASGIIGYFNGAVASIPAGWSEWTAGRGFVIVGVPSGGTVGGTVGSAFTNQQDKTHTHTGPSHDHDMSTGANETAASEGAVARIWRTGDVATGLLSVQGGGALTRAKLIGKVDAAGTGATGTAATSNVMAYIQQPAVVSA